MVKIAMTTQPAFQYQPNDQFVAYATQWALAALAAGGYTGSREHALPGASAFGHELDYWHQASGVWPDIIPPNWIEAFYPTADYHYRRDTPFEPPTPLRALPPHPLSL